MGRRRVVREGKATGTFVARGVNDPAVTVVATFDHEPGRTYVVHLTREQVADLQEQLAQQARDDRIETATCRDCGLDVAYDDQGMWPWRGIDGSDLCQQTREHVFGHRIDRDDAEKIFRAFQVRTGRKARHAL